MGRRSRFVLDGVVVAHQPGAILRTDRLGVHRFVRVDGAAAPAPVPAVVVSLGSTLIASGMLRKPVTAANDPLAPIRRMSQVEKIAFFS